MDYSIMSIEELEKAHHALDDQIVALQAAKIPIHAELEKKYMAANLDKRGPAHLSQTIGTGVQ